MLRGADVGFSVGGDADNAAGNLLGDSLSAELEHVMKLDVPGDTQTGPRVLPAARLGGCLPVALAGRSSTPLGVEDLELLASPLSHRSGRRLSEPWSAPITRIWTPAKASRRPLRFLAGFRLLFRGETGQASGWLGRAQRLLEGRDCVEQGYLLLPVVEQQLAEGLRCRARVAAAPSRSASASVSRTWSPAPGTCRAGFDPAGTGRLRPRSPGRGHGRGHRRGAVAHHDGPDLLQRDRGLPAGVRVGPLARVDVRPGALVRGATGDRRLHRRLPGAPLRDLQLHGAWPDAIEEARRACERSPGVDRHATAAALYQQGEVYRLRGEFAAAEGAYRDASQWGWEPQPGLALLRLAQGRPTRRPRRSAVSWTRHGSAAAREAAARLRRDHAGHRRHPGSANRLPRTRGDCAGIRYRSAARDRRACPRSGRARRRRRACGARLVAPRLRDVAASRGALRGRARAGPAGAGLPRARRRRGCGLELEAARAVFERLGAAPDVARIDSSGRRRSPMGSHRASCRCSAWWPPARPTRRSPRSCS